MPRTTRLPRPLGAGAAAALSLSLGLSLGPAAPPALAGPAGDPDPVPGLVAGRGTAAPQLVTGLAEPAPGDPAAAARAHLAAHPDRYRVDPGQLVEAGTGPVADGRRTVRFQQRHGGIPVLGAQYLVRLAGEGADQRVESVAGKYFTGLTAPTAPAVPDAMLRLLAVGELRDPADRAAAVAEDHGPVILPDGAGRLARHFTVRGTGPGAGARPAREVYVDATLGVVALVHDAHGPSAATATTAAAASAAPRAATAPGVEPGVEPATGTAPDVHGRPVTVNTGRLPDGSHRLVDLTRPATVTTYDAAGRDYLDLDREVPADVLPVASPTPDFPTSTGTIGATDAHVNAGIVADFYRTRLGREGIDGKGGPIVSVVNVTDGGAPLANAAWDGKKMIYGTGDSRSFPYSVALDVVGHEMTHGVIARTAGLEGFGQPGAMNEALADYFGNAIEVTARGLSMNDPRAGLLGESLCRTGTPESCATRRLDVRRTTVDDFLGAGKEVDSAGAHLNADIFGGALWDVRRTLDPLLADELIYRALTDHLTPLDDFVDGRNAVLVAGRELNLSRAQLRTVAAAFDAHGIRPGWQQRLGLDSRPLLHDLSAPTGPAVADGRWVMTKAAPNAGSPLYTGPVNGGGTPTRLSPEDNRAHSWASTDGRSAAWLALGTDAQGTWGVEVLTRSLSGGPVRSLFRASDRMPGDIRISGGDIAYRVSDPATGLNRIHLSRNGAPTVEIPLPESHDLSDLTLKDGILGWSEHWTGEKGEVHAVTAYSIATGKVIAQYLTGDPRTATSSTLLAGGRLLWLETTGQGKEARSTIRSGALDGSGTTDLLPGRGPDAPRITSLTASDQAVTYTYASAKPTTGWSNAALPKLWQLPITGGTAQRVSCNRGGQYLPAAGWGTQVLWLDATTGVSDLVVRDRPAGTC
ncbi:M4 family metallopeptidase [Kitasatospora sp. NPDC004240]